MRRALLFVVALWFGAAGTWAAVRQDAASGAIGTSQAPASAVVGQAPPAENGNSPEQKVREGKSDSAAKTASKSRAGPPVAGGNAARHKAAVPKTEDSPHRIVVRHGGASEPAAQIAPGMTPAEAVRQRQSTERLLGATGDQLQLLSARSLDEQQQETVGLIRNFMNGARAALQEGDLRRANTLAEKAHLLSDDLLRH